ncbi:MAG: tyrosine-type recombinase/integrase [Eubacteriales bacterium]|nr:tyrosine-type recombinase/integrase [Eubacteriales bacterium]
MAKAKKLPSGSWRTLVYSHTVKIDGKDKKIYESFTAETKSESELMAAEFKVAKKTGKKKGKRRKKADNRKLTVAETIEKYLTMRELLSPTTLEAYGKIKEYAFQNIMDATALDLDDESMQLAVNEEAKRITEKGTLISPKTVANEYGLLSSAISAVHGIKFNVVLPTRPEKNKDLPEPQEVIQAIKGTWVELPCLLAIWLSFSMSEVRGIKCSSVKNGVLGMDRVIVDVDNKPVEKEAGKAKKRTRKHQLPAYVLSLIEEQETYKEYLKTGVDGYLIPLTRGQIYGRYKTLTEKAGVDISFHDLRHLNASVMLALNVPEKYAMERGGWKTPHVMKKVYQHTFSSERKIVDERIDEYFNKIL